MGPYDFYNLSEEDRISLVGTHWESSGYELFPVWLDDREFNYRSQQGLIFVTRVLRRDCVDMVRVGALSPDDLDLTLDVEGGADRRQEIIEFLSKADMINRFYMDILIEVRDCMGGGKLDPDPFANPPKGKRKKYPRWMR